jgi:Beta-lactamase
MAVATVLAAGPTSPSPACASHATPTVGQRFPKAAFKGVELYSWRKKTGGFNYSLLWGTNRNKSETEVKWPGCTLRDMSAVKTALSHLAIGEWVTWRGDLEHMTLAYPSPEAIDALRAYSKELGITLNAPPFESENEAAERPDGVADSQTYTVQEATRLRREVTLENWDDGGERSRFAYLNISQLFPVAIVRRAGPIVALPSDPNPAVGRYVVEKEGGRDITLDQLLSDGPFDAFLVVHRGRIVYERYPRMRPDDKHLLFSVTKALIGTAVAILEDRGDLSVDQPIGA